MTIPNMVPTVHTRLLAARLIEACERADTTGTDAVHQYLFACKKGQEVALVAAILDQKTGATPPGPDLYDDGTKPNLEAVCWAAIDAAADLYGATPEQVLRGNRRQTDVPARRAAMTVAYLLGFGYSEIGRFLQKGRSTVVTAVKWCLADPVACVEAERIADQIRKQLHADEGENDGDE